MKKSICLVSCLLALTLTSTFGQQPASPPRTTPFPQPGITPTPASSELTKFNLDFPGGTPKELVAAIQKATGKPLNAIVPDEFASMKLPPLKMNNVDVPRLFQALELTSQKIEAYVTGNYYGGLPGMQQQYQQMRTGYGFKTLGTPSDDSIWYFYADKPSLPPSPPVTKVCHFYPLSPYLDRGLTVDDITTAIQTGWKMQGDTSPPQISFHKETKLLIAVGEPSKLEIIDAVLKALDTPKPKAPASKPAEQPKPAQE
ncbi:MAG TPA: hypothetical protein VF437_10665 [Verrucomicrobiae bacterium]